MTTFYCGGVPNGIRHTSPGPNHIPSTHSYWVNQLDQSFGPIFWSREPILHDPYARRSYTSDIGSASHSGYSSPYPSSRPGTPSERSLSPYPYLANSYRSTYTAPSPYRVGSGRSIPSSSLPSQNSRSLSAFSKPGQSGVTSVASPTSARQPSVQKSPKPAAKAPKSKPNPFSFTGAVKKPKKPKEPKKEPKKETAQAKQKATKSSVKNLSVPSYASSTLSSSIRSSFTPGSSFSSTISIDGRRGAFTVVPHTHERRTSRASSSRPTTPTSTRVSRPASRPASRPGSRSSTPIFNRVPSASTPYNRGSRPATPPSSRTHRPATPNSSLRPGPALVRTQTRKASLSTSNQRRAPSRSLTPWQPGPRLYAATDYSSRPRGRRRSTVAATFSTDQPGTRIRTPGTAKLSSLQPRENPKASPLKRLQASSAQLSKAAASSDALRRPFRLLKDPTTHPMQQLLAAEHDDLPCRRSSISSSILSAYGVSETDSLLTQIHAALSPKTPARSPQTPKTHTHSPPMSPLSPVSRMSSISLVDSPGTNEKVTRISGQVLESERRRMTTSAPPRSDLASRSRSCPLTHFSESQSKQATPQATKSAQTLSPLSGFPLPTTATSAHEEYTPERPRRSTLSPTKRVQHSPHLQVQPNYRVFGPFFNHVHPYYYVLDEHNFAPVAAPQSQHARRSRSTPKRLMVTDVVAGEIGQRRIDRVLELLRLRRLQNPPPERRKIDWPPGTEAAPEPEPRRRPGKKATVIESKATMMESKKSEPGEPTPCGIPPVRSPPVPIPVLEVEADPNQMSQLPSTSSQATSMSWNSDRLLSPRGSDACVSHLPRSRASSVGSSGPPCFLPCDLSRPVMAFPTQHSGTSPRGPSPIFLPTTHSRSESPNFGGRSSPSFLQLHADDAHLTVLYLDELAQTVADVKAGMCQMNGTNWIGTPMGTTPMTGTPIVSPRERPFM